MSSQHTDRYRAFAGMLVMVALAGAYGIACDEGSNAVKEPVPDAGALPSSPDGGAAIDGGGSTGDGGPSDCFMNPTTHYEIINACTNAVKITKNPSLPKLLLDGGLPTLP